MEDSRRMARAFYRIVQTNPPTRRDFLSNQARQREPRPGSPTNFARYGMGYRFTKRKHSHAGKHASFLDLVATLPK